MATRMQQRRGTAQQWTEANPRLAAGEIGLETDTNKFKIGDDVNFWDDLAYFVNSDGLSGELEGFATEDYVDSAIENVVGLAPETLNTLAELADALGDNPSAITTLQSDVAALQNAAAPSGTPSNTPDTIVQRDGEGDFSAQDVTVAKLFAAGSPGSPAVVSRVDGDSIVNANVINASVLRNGLGSGGTVFEDAVFLGSSGDFDNFIATHGYVDDAIAAIPLPDLTGYATESYVDTAIENVVGLAPETLDTLAELATALGDDPNAITSLQNNKADTNSPTFTGLTDFEGIVDFSEAVVIGIETGPVQSSTPHPFSMIG